MPLSKRKISSDDDLSSNDEVIAPSKKAKTKDSNNNNRKVQEDDDGNVFWELTGRRRVTISEYNKKTMVSIREYYEKDGKELPGKKGISLPLEQLSAFVTILPQIEEQLKSKGQNLPRPDYGNDTAMNDEDSEHYAEDFKEEKKNYEETSEEDE